MPSLGTVPATLGYTRKLLSAFKTEASELSGIQPWFTADNCEPSGLLDIGVGTDSIGPQIVDRTKLIQHFPGVHVQVFDQAVFKIEHPPMNQW